MKRAAVSPTFFRNAAQFRVWLNKNSGSEDELVVGFHKVESGRPSMSWSESVDEAASSAGYRSFSKGHPAA